MYDYIRQIQRDGLQRLFTYYNELSDCQTIKLSVIGRIVEVKPR
jgi:hypothetical protein